MQTTHPLPDPRLPVAFGEQLQKNITQLSQHLQDCDDVKTIHKHTDDHTISFFYCSGLVDTHLMNDDVMPEIYQWVNRGDLQPESFPFLTINIAKDDQKAIKYLFQGYLLCLLDGVAHAFCFDVANIPERQPEETPSETSVRGARDGFTESLTTNIALVRKRMKSGSLKCKTYQIGTRSGTKVALLYLGDVANPAMIQEVDKKLSQIKVETLASSQQLQELFGTFRLLPLFDYTSRTDYATSMINHGRFCIIVDGNPTVITSPTTITNLLKSAEDIHSMFIVNSFQYLLRLAGITIALLLPAFWVAITFFHPNQIPFQLLSTLVMSRRGIPLSIPFETILMLLIFEVFREAGLRLPLQIGQTLSVVGGLIVGDAAIRSGLTSPSTVVIVAMSFVASSTLVNQSVIGMISIARFFFLLLSGFLGIFGFVLALFLTFLYLANLKSFDVPFLAPLSPFHLQDVIRTAFRPTWRQMHKRPSILQTQDATYEDKESNKNEN